MYFRGKGEIEQEAYVIRLLERGLVVFLPSYGIEGLIALESEGCSLDADSMSLKIQNGGSEDQVRLFQKVLVGMKVVENESTLRPKLVISLKKISHK